MALPRLEPEEQKSSVKGILVEFGSEKATKIM
jgi:hypothetical protein